MSANQDITVQINGYKTKRIFVQLGMSQSHKPCGILKNMSTKVPKKRRGLAQELLSSQVMTTDINALAELCEPGETENLEPAKLTEAS